MLLTPVGEDSIVICKECGFKANMEAAECIVENESNDTLKALEKVHTPNCSTIEEVSEFLNVSLEKTCKAVVYQKNSDDAYVVIFIRGDLEVNETKVRNYIGDEIHPAVITEECGIVAGFIGPVGITENCTVLFDVSLKNSTNLVCGANEEAYHYIGFNIDRDVEAIEYHDFAKIKEHGICPVCGAHSITISRGIEVGNIFQLGQKYTKAMDMTYLDAEGKPNIPIMGCYGIGVGRLAASVCEAHHDEYGPIWPMSIAPWQVHLCAVRADDEEVKKTADKIYETLIRSGIEVVYDDRSVSAGVMFSDADLLGVPLKLIVSPRSLKNNCCEISSRDKSISENVPVENAVERTHELVNMMMAK